MSSQDHLSYGLNGCVRNKNKFRLRILTEDLEKKTQPLSQLSTVAEAKGLRKITVCNNLLCMYPCMFPRQQQEEQESFF